MDSRLHRLLAAIAPARTYDRLTRRAGDALATYRIQSARITDWEAFRGCLIRFLRQLDHHLLGLPPSVPTDVEMLWSRCVSVLNEIYGPSGAKAAYECVRTGVEGGLTRLLTSIAFRMADQYAENQIKAQVWAYWDSLSVTEKLAATDEYLQILGPLVPEEMREGGLRIRADLPRILIQHSKHLRRLEESCRRS